MSFVLKMGAAAVAVAGVGLALTFRYGPITTVQKGYRGVGIETGYRNADVDKLRDLNKVGDIEPPQDPAGTPSSGVYQNVKVLGKVDSNEFLRDMASITAWVAPVQGCTYCHSQENLAWDSLYTKIVARRMLQMTAHINNDWQSHVGKTGVTCYTCHRGMPVPNRIWFNAPLPAPAEAGGVAEVNQGKNIVNVTAGYSDLPYDPLTPFLEQSKEIRVNAEQALPGTDRSSIKQAEWTYSLMMYFSTSLGVNCTYCHNSRAFADWSQSTPQRVTAWYGIRMVRDLNNNFLDKLQGVFPKGRLGPTGDVPKLACATCHQGVYKPLYGVSMLSTYPELAAGGQVDTQADYGKVLEYPKTQ
jgi:photosynthetic reaction center cytochrome c subunit